jgi:MFS family permease
MWPTGVALCSEAWSEVSRPMLAGLIGTAANVGIVLMGYIATLRDITPADWRWVMLVAASPFVLGLLVFQCVPESPAWLAAKQAGSRTPQERPKSPVSVVFRPPFLGRTLIGIAIGAIPLLGGWGSGNWTTPWADKVYQGINDSFKGHTVMARSGGAVIGALFGGWLASLLGRRATYFGISLASLAISAWLFRWMSPADGFPFLAVLFLLGLVSTIFFGWLPLYLPELFPTHVRATGAGVTFNFGRIVTAGGVLATTSLVQLFQGDYGKVGSITSLIYALGMIVILFAPDTTKSLQRQPGNGA